MKRFYWLLLSAATVAPLAARAQTTPMQPPAGTLPSAAPTGPWSLQGAVDYALTHNLNVRQSQLQAQNIDATLLQSRAALLPSVNLNGSQVWNYGTTINPLTNVFQSQTTRNNNFSAASQVTLFSGFQLRNTIRRNALDYEAALSDVEKARNDLSLNVASAYLQMLLAQELVRTNEIRSASTQLQVEQSQKLLKAGAVAESNLLDSQAQLSTDQLNVITAQNQLAIAKIQLAQLLNLDEAASQALTIEAPELAAPDENALADVAPGEVFLTAQARQPEIKAAELRVQSSLRGVELARGAYYPRLTFGASIFTGYSSLYTLPVTSFDSAQVVLPIFPIDPVTGLPSTTPAPLVALTPFQPIVRRSSENVSYFTQLDNNLGKNLQFNLQIPILNGLQVRTNVQRAKINQQLAEVRSEQARLALRQTIEQSYADALAAQRQYLASSRQVEALTLAYRNAEIRFNNGLLNGTEFNIAKNNLTAAESSMIQAKYSFVFRRKVLDFYQGRPISL
ncbi:TolC family protein [Hymenobacter psychrophilus]|uniref:Outer membrane protein n=1 Tax=Hymenobacter psychrophilus TaxID=651662 RepID=A0A1H3LR66_9BACT|nr:TolC family protein [Hymenobacter psychrophilus]SDY66820.1 outer membrane protein [Hymenobacter psychrophilus]